jgi:hypothetical protein
VKLLGDKKKKLNLEYYQKYIQVYSVPKVEVNKIRQKVKDSNNYIRYLNVQQGVLEFEDIKEVKEISKFKIITNKAA